jgi:hypothetical protein
MENHLYNIYTYYPYQSTSIDYPHIELWSTQTLNPNKLWCHRHMYMCMSIYLSMNDICKIEVHYVVCV